MSIMTKAVPSGTYSKKPGIFLGIFLIIALLGSTLLGKCQREEWERGDWGKGSQFESVP